MNPKVAYTYKGKEIEDGDVLDINGASYTVLSSDEGHITFNVMSGGNDFNMKVPIPVIDAEDLRVDEILAQEFA